MRTTLFAFIYFFTLNCCIAPFCYSAELPVSIQTETVAYSTLDDAAKAALNEATSLSTVNKTEFGGILLERDGQFFYTAPVSTSETSALDFKARFQHGSNFVGLYHTHPGSQLEAELFSPPDVEIATKLQITSYIGVLRSNTIHKFKAGDRTEKLIETFVKSSTNTVAKGETI